VNAVRRSRFSLALLGFLTAVAGSVAAEDLPDAGTVVRALIEQASRFESNRLTGSYVFYRTNITEEFRRDGSVQRREELLLRVTAKDDAKEVELVQLNGREPTSRERERELKRFGRRRNETGGRDRPDRSRELNAFLTPEILNRFVFTVRGREEHEGRPCLVLAFRPGNSGPRSGKVMDRVLDRIGGVLWIDETEHELAKADIQLQEGVSFWGGFLGGLEVLRLQLERTWVPEGRWRDRQVEARFVGRAVTRRIDVRTRDFSSAQEPLRETSVVAAD